MSTTPESNEELKAKELKLLQKGLYKCHRRGKYLISDDTNIIIPYKDLQAKEKRFSELKLNFEGSKGEMLDFVWVNPLDYLKSRESYVQEVQAYVAPIIKEEVEEEEKIEEAKDIAEKVMQDIEDSIVKVEPSMSLDSDLAIFKTDKDLPDLRKYLKSNYNYSLHPAVKKIKTAKEKAKQAIEK